MREPWRSLLAASVAALVVTPGSTQAAEVRLGAVGTVQLQLGDDGVLVGDDVAFVWRFDSKIDDAAPDARFGLYLIDLDGVDVAFGVTDPNTGDPIRDYTCNEFSIEVENNVPDGDTYAAAASADFDEFCVDDLGNRITFVGLVLVDSTATAFANDDLPLSLDLASFDPYDASFITSAGCFQHNPSCLPSGEPVEDGFVWFAEINDIVTLPEPEQAARVGVGLVVLLAAVRRRRATAPKPERQRHEHPPRSHRQFSWGSPAEASHRGGRAVGGSGSPRSST